MTGPIPGTRTLFGGGGISGLALLVGLAGVILVQSGIKNAPVQEILSSYLTRRPTNSLPPTVTAVPWTSAGAGQTVSRLTSGAAVAADAAKYADLNGGKGVPYVWAGETPDGWDCSGFVTWVLHHDFGIELPDNTHTVTGQFYVWSGATTVPRSQTQAGDLVCWLGHIGIATDANTMVNAPGVGLGTRIQPIYDVPAPVIRRPKAYATIGVN